MWNLIIALIITSTAYAVDIYILAGESNMKGNSTIAEYPEEYQLLPTNCIYHYEDFIDQTLDDSDISYGLEVPFMNYISSLYTSEEVVFIKYAVENANLQSDWIAGGTADTSGDGEAYTQLQNYVTTAVTQLQTQHPEKSYNFAGFLWSQGESDALLGRTTEEYTADLTNFIADVRLTYGDIPFIFNRLSSRASTITESGGNIANIQLAQDAVNSGTNETQLLNIDDLDLTDGLHYSTSELIELGTRYAHSMESLLSNTGQPAYQANSFKVGELAATQASIWTRTTTTPEPLNLSAITPVYDVAPGIDGEILISWNIKGQSNTFHTSWLPTDSNADYIAKYTLTDLEPNTTYTITVQSRALNGTSILSTRQGEFTTAPATNEIDEVHGVVLTCQEFVSSDDDALGHKVYQEIAQSRPDFYVHTGDIIYYDVEFRHEEQPAATSLAIARHMWNKTFAMPWQRDCGEVVPAYFMKDDHDTYVNDCYPGIQQFSDMGTFSFEKGVALFKEQTPIIDLPYRNFRWGQDLEIWLIEGRDYRSSNLMADGPLKTILGAEQKEWLKQGIASSDATFKLVISPTPIIGPDAATKADNHANDAFLTEGNELRSFLASQPNTYVICGDRHWQYASIDPVTNLREYSCGAVNKAHRIAGQYNAEYNTYYAKRGGYFSFHVTRYNNIPQITFKWHDIDLPDFNTGLATIAYEETLRPEGEDTISIVRDHIADTVKLRKSSIAGKYYLIQQSANLQDWENVGINLTTHGQTLEFPCDKDRDRQMYYRVIEADTSFNVPTPLSPSQTDSQTTLFSSATYFNRMDFVLDLTFTMPSVVDDSTDYLLYEVGGSGRGTTIGLVDGMLTISAGRTGQSVIDLQSDTPLVPGTEYTLRLDAVCEAAAGADSMTISMWAADDTNSTELYSANDLSLDGFSGSNGGGVGVLNSTYFNNQGLIPSTDAPAEMRIYAEVYDPDHEIGLLYIPELSAP